MAAITPRGIPDPGGIGKKAESVVTGGESAVEGTGKFFGELESGELWIRVAETLGGFMLLGIGLYGLFKPGGAKAGFQAAKGAAGNGPPVSFGERGSQTRAVQRTSTTGAATKTAAKKATAKKAVETVALA